VTDKTFTDLGVAEPLTNALAEQGITAPFPIQELTIPLALRGGDVIGQARTGTGKTLAFGLPLLQRIEPGTGRVQALVITPTRELAIQVAEDLQTAGAQHGVRVLTVYGGTPLEQQSDPLRAGAVDVAVGTPGRLLDHVRRRNLVLDDVAVLVLDEADRMLDMGFLPDVQRLMDRCADDRQTLLFSATMPSEIVALARRYMENPTFIRAEDEQTDQVAPETQQHFFVVHRLDKPRILARILQSPDANLATVFVRTKRMADRLVDELRGLGVKAAPIHGDLRQAKREQNLERFREGRSEVLVATEVAARGLDIDGVTHVVNYDCPDDEKMYLHRIGRTGRAGAAGVAVTFAEHTEVERLRSIKKRVGAAEQEIHEVFSTSDLLAELFDLPVSTPWAHLGAENGDSDRGTGDRGRGRGDGRGGRRSSGRRAGGGRRDGGGRSERGRDRPTRTDRAERREAEPAAEAEAEERTEADERRETGPTTEAGTATDSRSEEAATETSTNGEAESSAERARTRTRTREREAPTSERTRQREPRRPGGDRDRDDRGRSDRDRSDREGSRNRGSRGGDRGGSQGGDSPGGDLGSRDRGRGGGAGRGGSGRDSGQDSGRGSGNGSDREERQGRGRRRQESHGGGRGGSGQPRRGRTRSGQHARGEGKPGLGRRVRVEHLP
jgi:superfamily II DNA/RNA helicase